MSWSLQPRWEGSSPRPLVRPGWRHPDRRHLDRRPLAWLVVGPAVAWTQGVAKGARKSAERGGSSGTMRFVKESVIDASAAEVFAFHERPDALERLQPPWQATRILQPPTSLAVGTRVVLEIQVFGPFWQTLVAEHVAFEPGRMFADRMVTGPFASWLHTHLVTPKGPSRCVLTDDIEYELPLGVLGRVFGGAFARRTLERMFEFRHEVTRAACEESSTRE